MDNLIQFPIQRSERQVVVPRSAQEAYAIERWNAMGYDRVQIAERLDNFRATWAQFSEIEAQEYPKG